MNDDVDFENQILYGEQNKRRGVRCPWCRSTKTAKILWGMYDEEAEDLEEVKSGKLYFGGCSPEMVDIPNGTGFLDMGQAIRHCNACGKNY